MRDYPYSQDTDDLTRAVDRQMVDFIDNPVTAEELPTLTVAALLSIGVQMRHIREVLEDIALRQTPPRED